MNKVFSFLCAGSLVALATACGGSKATEADSDSVIALEADTIVAVDSVAPDTTVVDVVTGEAVEVVDNTTKKAENVANKATNTAKKGVNAAKDAAEKVADKAAEKANSALDKAINKTQEVAEKGVDEAAAKAKAWKDKKKKSE